MFVGSQVRSTAERDGAAGISVFRFDDASGQLKSAGGVGGIDNPTWVTVDASRRRLYAASEVTAKVGTGASVKVVEVTDYPFGDTVTLKIAAAQPVKFPLYLRIPRWCEAASVKINGKAVRCAAKPLSYVVLEREWKDGDTVSLRLPIEVRVQKWEKNQNAASVSYGVLTFSLKIGERWQRSGGTDAWPETEVFPTTPWNYGLVLDEKNPANSFKEVRRGGGPLPAQPFTPQTAPI